MSSFYFFFQAEDGIRDGTVTGVQTCALPIWPDFPVRNGLSGCHAHPLSPLKSPMPDRKIRPGKAPFSVYLVPWLVKEATRSEERRVGKSVDLGGRRIMRKKNEK